MRYGNDVCFDHFQIPSAGTYFIANVTYIDNRFSLTVHILCWQICFVVAISKLAQ